LLALTAAAAVSYGWGMGSDTIELFYGAAARSMSASWHDFFFGAFAPSGTITLDKLPGAVWLQALSLRAFGFQIWAIVLPQVIEGALTVLVLYRAVRRIAGPVAGIRRTRRSGLSSSAAGSAGGDHAVRQLRMKRRPDAGRRPCGRRRHRERW
jgi:4-amino-4-deoxy-L-arabinose transferase-like glycosyltransferase